MLVCVCVNNFHKLYTTTQIHTYIQEGEEEEGEEIVSKNNSRKLYNYAERQIKFYEH